jgi:hypothetical protein
VGSSILKTLGQVNFTFIVNKQSAPYKTSVWLELNAMGRASVVCKHCRRSFGVTTEMLKENELVHCEWCRGEQQAWDAVLEARPDLLESAITAARTALIEDLNKRLEKTLRKSGLQVRRR